MVDTTFKKQVFDLVKQRLVDPARQDSLIRFCKHWQGTNSGIEGWFKLEFVAAIEPTVAIVRTGGAGGHGKAGQTFCDLKLEMPNGTVVPIETKAGCSNWYGTGKELAKYKGCVVAFIYPSDSPMRGTHDQELRKMDREVQIAEICKVDRSTIPALYFCMADLT